MDDDLIVGSILVSVLCWITWLVVWLVVDARRTSRVTNSFTAENLKVTAAITEASRQSAEQMRAVLQALTATQTMFHQSVQTFETLVHTMRDIENLQQVRGIVAQTCVQVETVQTRIGSQVEVSGAVVNELNALVKAWSAEGTELKQSYQRLAATVERALVLDAEKRQELLDWVKGVANALERRPS